jgi:hypothetical protein
MQTRDLLGSWWSWASQLKIFLVGWDASYFRTLHETSSFLSNGCLPSSSSGRCRVHPSVLTWLYYCPRQFLYPGNTSTVQNLCYVPWFNVLSGIMIVLLPSLYVDVKQELLVLIYPFPYKKVLFVTVFWSSLIKRNRKQKTERQSNWLALCLDWCMENIGFVYPACLWW